MPKFRSPLYKKNKTTVLIYQRSCIAPMYQPGTRKFPRGGARSGIRMKEGGSAAGLSESIVLFSMHPSRMPRGTVFFL
jgi:hypothetical protein